MSEYDPHIAAALDRLLPAGTATGDWAAVIRDAREPRTARLLEAARRRRAVAVVAVCGLAVLVAVPALAVTNGWWFLDFGGPRPASDVVVVKTGTSSEGRWALTAYLSESQGICVALTVERPSSIGAQGCGAPVRGAPAADGTAPRDWLGYVYTRGDDLIPTFVFGPAAAPVMRIELVFADGTTQTVETIPAPERLGLRVRFYVAQVETDSRVRAVVARGAGGETLERLEINPIPRTAPRASD
jgi:hypothetical protein